MLGELVELQIHPPPGEAVELGDVLGTVEGFKALSDVYCVGQGTFVGGNPAVQADLDLIARDPYEAGWIYAIEGEPDARSLDVEGYRQLLDDIIDRMMARQKLEEEAP
jgi:glycine cleavage system H protein